MNKINRRTWMAGFIAGLLMASFLAPASLMAVGGNTDPLVMFFLAAFGQMGKNAQGMGDRSKAQAHQRDVELSPQNQELRFVRASVAEFQRMSWNIRNSSKYKDTPLTPNLYVTLAGEAQERYRAAYEGKAPSAQAFETAVFVNEQVIQVLGATAKAMPNFEKFIGHVVFPINEINVAINEAYSLAHMRVRVARLVSNYSDKN